jgi:hypothetical protein
MRRGKAHHQASCHVRGYAVGGRNLMGGAGRSDAELLAAMPSKGRRLGVWRTLKESVSPWELAEAVVTQRGSRFERRP